MLFFLFAAGVSGSESLDGEWVLIPDQSADIDLYGSLSLNITRHGDSLTIVQHWGRGSRFFDDSLTVVPDGTIRSFPVRSRLFPSNVFMGIAATPGEKRHIQAHCPDRQTLIMDKTKMLRGSQGPRSIKSRHRYHVSEDGLLSYTLHRSTRPTPLIYRLKRPGDRNARFMILEDDWRLDGKLDRQAFLISLQGLVNRDQPLLYFIYPDSWDFRFTEPVKTHLEKQRGYTFTLLEDFREALNVFRPFIQGYVVWDKKVRTSLIVAFTAAGLNRAVVVSEAMIPLMQAAGIRCVEDFRGRFTEKSDHEIYSWAVDAYWNQCSRELIVWMGGEHGPVMKPGVADWGIQNRAFFQDLSTAPRDTLEFQLAARLLSELNPHSLIFGWHSYKKDLERDHVTLTSSYGHRVEGLHTLPNLSFSSLIPAAPGFRFQNNHSVQPGQKLKAQKKVYIACIQTDCLGLGAWTRPGRGEIPYAWEVTMNWVWLAPAMMEYFYSQATPNDYFIGALSGPGYLYPKAVPPNLLPPLIDQARQLMETLDLRIFEIMDYSEGATVEGNTELTREVVDSYYQGMPEAIGFVNGYAPAYTFHVRDGRPLISYDYYLSPVKSEKEAVDDLLELAAFNAKRPYFLLMHVRQWSDIHRVKNILTRLGPEFEVVPLDLFLTLAGQNPTFMEKFLEPEGGER